MFELIFVAVIHGQMQETKQKFQTMGQCQSVLKSIKEEVHNTHDARIITLTCKATH